MRFNHSYRIVCDIWSAAAVRDQLWAVEKNMNGTHWMAPALKDCSHDTHLYLLSGGPIDATNFIPVGSMSRVSRYSRHTHIPREI